MPALKSSRSPTPVAGYEIDLGEKNKAKLEKALQSFIGAARKAGGNQAAARRPSGRPASRPTSAGLDLNAVRRCAAEQRIEVAKRGRLARNVLDALRKANWAEPVSASPAQAGDRSPVVAGPLVPVGQRLDSR